MRLILRRRLDTRRVYGAPLAGHAHKVQRLLRELPPQVAGPLLRAAICTPAGPGKDPPKTVTLKRIP